VSAIDKNPSKVSRDQASPSWDTMSLSGLAGLTEDDASLRLQQDGPNELPTQKKRSFWAIAVDVAREPMFLMLVAAGVLYLLMGEPADALMLLGFVFVVMAITIVQERRTERALEALRERSSFGREYIGELPGAKLCEVILWFSPRATECLRTASCGEGSTLRRMSRS
jgi:magnesium-transporting ATPase (P-type)